MTEVDLSTCKGCAKHFRRVPIMLKKKKIILRYFCSWNVEIKYATKCPCSNCLVKTLCLEVCETFLRMEIR